MSPIRGLKSKRAVFIEEQLQLTFLVFVFTTFISNLHAPFAWLPFPFYPSFILPFPAVCTGSNSISLLVYNRLSACLKLVLGW